MQSPVLSTFVWINSVAEHIYSIFTVQRPIYGPDVK